MPNTVLAALPISREFDNSGLPLGGGLLYTYQAGSTTPLATYQDLAGTVLNANPMPLDSTGRANIRYQAGMAYKLVLTDVANNILWSRDNFYPPLTDLTSVGAAGIGAILYPQTQAEQNASVTPANYAYPSGNVLRYGVLPNNMGAASANAAALIALFNPQQLTGPTGRFFFPNTTGADVYYIGDIIQVRDGCDIDLQGSTLNFNKTRVTADNTMGFFTFIRNVTVRNGFIVVNYNGTGGTNAGTVFRLGSRNGYPFSTYSSGIFDQDSLVALGLKPMGNLVLRDLVVTTNNPAAHVLLSVGGVQDVTIDNCVFDGGSVAIDGLHFEFGFSSQNGQPGTQNLWSSSHPNNIRITNTRVLNLIQANGTAGVALVGAYNCVVENLYVNGAATAVTVTPGEALFFRVWSLDDPGGKRNIMLRNIVGENISSDGLLLQGAQSASGGYLSGAGLTSAQQTDLYHFSVDGFALSATGRGVHVSGPITLRNGTMKGTQGSGGLCLTEECMRATVENVTISGSSSLGVRMNTGEAIWSPVRLKSVVMTNCKVISNTGVGIDCAYSRSVELINCQVGATTLLDSANEATQTTGIECDGTNNGGGVHARGCFVTTASGTAYVTAGTPTATNGIYNPLGEITTSGLWDVDGAALDNGTNLADKTAYINTVGKYKGRKMVNSSTNKLFVAQGAVNTSTWISTDGATTVTPV